MKALNDATSALIRAVASRFPDQRLIVEEISSRSWASATFNGARHTLTFRIEGALASEAADAFLADLGAAEFSMRGHFMADLALVSEERQDGGGRVTISLEALTVEDD